MQKKFPIIGWADLPSELTHARAFANIQRSGVNVIMTCREPQAAIRQQLDLAAEHGLQAIVWDARFRASHAPDWRDKALAAVREYGQHPALFGFFVADEPRRERFESVTRMVALLRSEMPDRIACVNAFGSGCWGMDSFFEYAEEYARVIKPSFLSFDCYPLSRIPEKSDAMDLYHADCGIEWPELGAYYRDCYWEAWETFRLVGWKYDLPLWGFAMSAPHKHSIWDYRPVTEGTVRLEAFTGLAHGIQALQYFTMTRFPVAAFEDGIIDLRGEPSVRFDMFQRVNHDIGVLGSIVKDLTCGRVFHTGPLTSACCRFVTMPEKCYTSHRPVSRLGGDPVIVSFLKGKDKGYMMLVNRNPGRSGRVEIEIETGWRPIEILKQNGAESAPLAASFCVDLEPGDGRLFRLDQTAPISAPARAAPPSAL